MKMIHAAAGAAESRIWTPVFRRELEKLGTLEIIGNAASCREGELLARLRQADVLLGSWGSLRIPDALAADPGRYGTSAVSPAGFVASSRRRTLMPDCR